MNTSFAHILYCSFIHDYDIVSGYMKTNQRKIFGNTFWDGISQLTSTRSFDSEFLWDLLVRQDFVRQISYRNAVRKMQITLVIRLTGEVNLKSYKNLKRI